MAPPVITVIHSDVSSEIRALLCCAGYEKGLWRKTRLAKHLLDWLPDCALTPEEKQAANPLVPYRTLETAARRFFSPEVRGPRGELGELLVHAICSQECKTRQFVARLFYKMRSNDQVTGFDIVHLRLDEKTDELELWLGEAKFYKNFSGALNSAIASLSAHIDAGFLEETKSLIGPKISKSDPLYEKLSWIFDSSISLDEIIDRMVVPVLIAADCQINGEVGSFPANYLSEAKERLLEIQERLLEEYGTELAIVAIYLPLNDKAALEEEFNNRLSALT
jgi:hypothetical protein